jgi:hypothetical protein
MDMVRLVSDESGTSNPPCLPESPDESVKTGIRSASE